MKKIFLLLCIVLSLQSTDFKSISLVDFSSIVSNTTNYNIVVSDTLDKNISLFLPNLDFYNKKKTLRVLKNILKYNNLSYKFSDNVIYIYNKNTIHKKDFVPIQKSFIIKFSNLTNKDIDSYFKRLYPTLKYFILKGRIFLTSTKKEYNTIKHQISMLDNSFISRTISVTVLSTNNNLLKNKGIDFSILKFNPNYYINLVTSTVSFPAVLTSKFQFYSFLHFLKENKISNILSNPQIVLSDNKNSLLESTTNIPFLTSTTSTKDNTTTTQNSYTYKDIGLKIYFTNVSISDNVISFDLELYIQSILDTSITPKTTSKHIKTHCTLTKDNLFFLGGLNDTIITDSVSNVPLLEFVPIINKVTSHVVKQKEKVTFSVVLSIVK